MNTFPLFHPYPLTERDGFPLPLDLHADSRPILSVRDEHEMMRHSYDRLNGSAIISKFNDSFEQVRSKALKARLVPFYKTIPEATKYQRYEECNPSKLRAEIQEYGVNMAPGQVLFHGGDFSFEDVHYLGTGPFFSTFSPVTALWHAYNDGRPTWSHREGRALENPAVLVLTVSICFNQKAIVFRGAAPGMGDEREALFCDIGKILPRSEYVMSEPYNPINVICATLI
ncbi:hypothetical protein G3N57_21125 [Paraburkholderia sp. Se-20369]|nr:hypothetical protein [Paraburkholderia sp. Se-20369]